MITLCINPFASGRAQQQPGVDGAGRFTEHSYASGIAAKLRDVLVDPLERRDLVEQSVVPEA